MFQPHPRIAAERCHPQNNDLLMHQARTVHIAQMAKMAHMQQAAADEEEEEGVEQNMVGLLGIFVYISPILHGLVAWPRCKSSADLHGLVASI